MSRDRFTVLGTTRLPLSDGDWIDVKTGLTAGEQRKQDAFAVIPHRMSDGSIVDRIDWSEYEFLRTDLWVVDWSLTKTVNGKVQPIPKTLAAIKALEPEDFEEINTIVYNHIREWVQGKAKRAKERTPDETKSAPISQS